MLWRITPQFDAKLQQLGAFVNTLRWFFCVFNLLQSLVAVIHLVTNAKVLR